MKKILFLLGFIFISVFVAGCSVPMGCTEEAKICPDGSTVGRAGIRCQFAECPEVSCQQDSDCAVGIRVKCCNCPEAYPKNVIGSKPFILAYPSEQYAAAAVQLNCSNIQCEPCLDPKLADVKCVEGQCKLVQR